MIKAKYSVTLYCEVTTGEICPSKKIDFLLTTRLTVDNRIDLIDTEQKIIN